MGLAFLLLVLKLGEVSMKKILFYFIFIITLSLSSLVFAENLANDRLLELLQQKGFLTEEEVKSVKEILVKDEAKNVEVVYEEGLHVRTKDRSFDTRIGGVIQSDLIMFDSHYPVNNDFDIRRARVFLTGRLFKYFNYKFEAELEGSNSNRLVDAYMNFDYFPYLQFQVGQFKEPFSLEHLISDKYLPFNERSMAYSLTPARDVGFMFHGSLFKDSINYAIGMFNGDGRDANRRDQKDDKEVTGRLTAKPFNRFGPSFLKGLQIGGSFSYARLDTSDLNVAVRTPARTKFFTVNSRAKYHIIQDVDNRERYGLELAYTYGPLVIMGEYIRNDYSDVLLASEERFDFDLRGWYLSLLFMLTGEEPIVKGGILERIRPRNCFNLDERGWGAWGIGLRYQQFEAGRNVYEYLVQEGISVRRANAFTVALNWYLNSMVRFTLNYSRTSFAQSLFLETSPEGYSYYEDTENVWVTRFQLEF